MSREKRSEIVRSRITPSMRAAMDEDRREKSRVISMSDYLFELVEERIAVRIAKQTIGRRVGNQ